MAYFFCVSGPFLYRRRTSHSFFEAVGRMQLSIYPFAVIVEPGLIIPASSATNALVLDKLLHQAFDTAKKKKKKKVFSIFNVNIDIGTCNFPKLRNCYPTAFSKRSLEYHIGVLCISLRVEQRLR